MRPELTTNLTKKERQNIAGSLRKRAGKGQHSRDWWVHLKKQEHIAAGLYRKTIRHTIYIYKPLGDHLWERTSEDGRNRTLVKHLPDDLD